MDAVGPDTARAIRDVVAAANKMFPRLPPVRLTTRIADTCGRGSASRQVRYCASQNVIFLHAELAAEVPEGAAAYIVAHALGHASQVRHGVADVALATIRREPQNEAALRSMVTRQVECLAGVFFARADMPRSRISDWFVSEPFTGAHWGAEPVSSGPRVSIGLAARDEWFARGQAAGDVSVCAVERFGSELLENAQR